MNIFSIIGLCMSIGVLLGGLMLSSDDLTMFLDYPSLFIVLGGTLAATAISFRLNRFMVLAKIFLKHVFSSSSGKNSKLVSEIIKIVSAINKGESIESFLPSVKDPFLKEALTILNDGFLSNEELIEILEERLENMNSYATEEANKIKVISKFPPAFGMMGTTIGMIVLLANLGGEDALKMIGPAMGVCLITTLYGVAFANLIIIPIGENLIEAAKEKDFQNVIIIEGVKQILKKSNVVYTAEKLNSFLEPKDRVDWKKIVS